MLDAVRNRRSIRHYQDRPVEPDVIEQLQDAILRAPSSRNLKPWRFVFVTDPALLQALARSRPQWAEPVGRAPLGVVICADASVTDCWIEDCSIAAATLQLVATELGLGSCWIQIRAREHEDGRPAEAHVREALGLPDDLSVLCIIATGYAAEDKPAKPAESLSWDKIDTLS
jgi:nitroreductase